MIRRGNVMVLRYYADAVNGKRVKVTETLCAANEKAAVIQAARRSRMAAINAEQLKDAPVTSERTIGEFFDGDYMAWATANLKTSTVRGYEKLWAGYLENDLGPRSLARYQTTDGTAFLTALAKRGLGRNSLHHARSLMSGIFSIAGALGYVKDNPIKMATWLAPPKAPREKIGYTDSECVAMLNAIERVDAKLLFALCAIMGLRPSESCGLQWPDIEADALHVRRAAPYGVPQESTKTDRSDRPLRLIEPVKALMSEWREACGKPVTGWVFARSNDPALPIVHSDFVKRHIRPSALKACKRFNGLYSGRHATGTALYDQKGDARASYQALGNSLDTAIKTYIRPSREAGDEGLRIRESTIAAEIEKQRVSR